MPTKNTIKTYIENGYYHIYNRGVDKREIFIEPQDCMVFLHYLKLYLSSPESLTEDKNLPPRMLYKVMNLNLFKEVDLLSFALMPNHFHLQIKQFSSNGIEKLCRRAITSYVQYFNKKYKRIGTLFESTYKAVPTQTEEQFLYLSAYIHRNPMKLKQSKFNFIDFSSYPYYLGEKHADWVKNQEVVSYFRTTKTQDYNDLSYQRFVENFRENPEEILGSLIIEVD